MKYLKEILRAFVRYWPFKNNRVVIQKKFGKFKRCRHEIHKKFVRSL